MLYFILKYTRLFQVLARNRLDCTSTYLVKFRTAHIKNTKAKGYFNINNYTISMLPLTAFHLNRGQCLVHVNYSQSSPMHRFSDMSSCNALYFMKNKVSLINTALVHFLAFFFFDFSASSWAFLLAASLLACKRRMNAVKYFRGQ